jgi:hypothetical protein
MPSVGFEPTISAGERPKTYALFHAATGTGVSLTTSSELPQSDEVLSNAQVIFF